MSERRRILPDGPAVRRSGVVLMSILLLGSLGACGSSGSGEAERPAPRRSTLRIGNAAPIEMYNEAGRGGRVIPVPPAKVWEMLEGVYAQLEIPVTRRDHRVWEIGNMGYKARRIEGKRMNSWVDCGTNLSGQLANLYDVTISVVTRLTASEEGTQVVTTVDAHGEPRTTSGNQVHCQSREELEQRVADLVAGRFGIGAGRGW